MGRIAGRNGKTIKFLRYTTFPIVLSLATLGCSTLEKMIIDSPPGKEAVFLVENNFINSCNEKYSILDFGSLNGRDLYPDKPILLFIYGWGGTSEEFLYEQKEGEKNGKVSRLGVMRDVFDSRILLATYPSNKSIEKIFSGIEKPFLDFVDSYSLSNNGAKPKILIAGHSLGSQLARMLARKNPKDIKKVGLIAGVNDGINYGILTDFIKEFFPRQMEKILIKNKRPSTEENYQNIRDLITNSDFMKRLNTETLPLDVEYDFYAFSSSRGNFFMPDEDDTVVGLESSYPYRLIKEKRFEDVRIGDAIIIKGNVDHFSINNNLELFRRILESLKSEKQEYLKVLPKPKYAQQIIVP